MTQTLVFTREHALDDQLAQSLLEAGFELAHVPLIACSPNPMPDDILAILGKADWVLFTSAVAVDAFIPYCSQKTLKIATIGAQTSLAVQARGYEIAFEATSNYAVDFAREWLSQVSEPQRVLLPQSSLSNPILAEELTKAGHEVYAWPMYDTKPNQAGQRLLPTYLDKPSVMWTFASPSAWQSFRQVVSDLPASHQIAVIGTSTAKVVRADGFAVDLMPEKPAISAMVACILEGKRS